MNYDPDQIERTRDFMASARRKGLENEGKTGRNSGGGLTVAQRTSISQSVAAADGLYLDSQTKHTLLERFVMWSEHHGTKVENEQHPYLLRQLVEEYMKNDDWIRSGYDGKIGATIRGVIRENPDRADPKRSVNPPLRKSPTSGRSEAEKPMAVVPAAEVQQYMQDVRAAFKASGHTLQGSNPSINAAFTKTLDTFAQESGFNKFTVRHLVSTFIKMASHAKMPLSESMAAAMLPSLTAELQSNKTFLKSPDNVGMITLTVREGDVRPDLQKAFPLLCERAPHIIHRAVRSYQPHKDYLQKIMDYYTQLPETMPEDNRLDNAHARATAEYNSARTKKDKSVDRKSANHTPTKQVDTEPVLPSWLMPQLPAGNAGTHTGRVISGAWSKSEGNGRKK